MMRSGTVNSKSCVALLNITWHKCEDLLPVLTKIVYNSLQSGRFPEIWKEALVFPLLKKSGLDVIFKEIPSREQLVFCV